MKNWAFYGLLITLFQVAVAVGYAFLLKQSPAYLKLCNWDCGWYLSIVTHGYISTYPPIMDQAVSNVAFFPGYPILVRALWQYTGLDPVFLLIFVSQLFAWIFWTHFLLILSCLGFRGRAMALSVLAVLAHPASPYLILAYSESTFLASLLGLIYWSGKITTDRRAWILAGLSGFLMSATRLAGITMVLFPLIGRKWTVHRLAVSALTVFGVVSFFLFCHFRFGHGTLYMESGKAGWNIVPDYKFLFHSWTYWVPARTEMNYLDILSIYGSLSLFVAILLAEVAVARRPSSKFQDRAGFYLSAVLMFFLSGAGSASKSFVSLIRYTLPVYVLLLLGITHFVAHVQIHVRVRRLAWLVLPVLFFTLFWIYSLDMIKRFLTGAWAA